MSTAEESSLSAHRSHRELSALVRRFLSKSHMRGQLGGATTASLTPFVVKHFGWGAVFSGSRRFVFRAPLPG